MHTFMRWMGAVVAVLSLAGLAHADVDMKGGYLEAGGVFFAPIAGDKIATGDPGFGFRQLEVNPGGGLQVSAGYGFGVFAIGGKIYYAFLPQDPAGPPTGVPPATFGADLSADLYGMDIEGRVFPFAQQGWIVQPYGLVGLGWGVFNGDFRDPQLVWSMNFGLGLQLEINEHFYIAAEGSYRPIFAADPCGSESFLDGAVYSCDSNQNLHLMQAALNLGFRF